MSNKTGCKVVILQRQPYGGWRCDVFCEGGAGAFAVQSGDDPTLNDSGRSPKLLNWMNWGILILALLGTIGKAVLILALLGTIGKAVDELGRWKSHFRIFAFSHILHIPVTVTLPLYSLRLAHYAPFVSIPAIRARVRCVRGS